MKTPLLAAAAAAVTLLSVQAAQASGMDAAALAEPCAGCHGIDGTSSGPATPTIAGLTTDYFVLSMQDYKSDKRPSTVMGRIAKGYSDEEIEAMAAYFNDRKFGRPAQPFDATLAAKGKELQAVYCENCHEKDGQLADGIGVLGGQKLPYLHFSVEDFRSGVRAAERRKQQKMDDLMKAEGDAGYEAVLNYYASQQ